jgi:serine phosphatase RsbU (regulator of sigma subunit)
MNLERFYRSAALATEISGASPDSNEDLLLIDDEIDEGSTYDALNPRWRILIVDDEESVHQVTRLALDGFQFDGRGLDIDSAFSAAHARELLADSREYALMLVDVVMETDHAGLDFVNYVRNNLGNRLSRIVLRTGQPGLAPEKDVILKFDIDDYKAKTELTVDKLHTVVVTSLRSYQEIARIEGLVRRRTAELEEKNQDMLDSIKYARRIQTAILPPVDYINEFLPNFFVFFKPKDILSGDCYWFSQLGKLSILANIDCTGHGVPGAIMSVIAHNLLSQIVSQELNTDPEVILAELDRRLRDILQRDGADGEVKDGMDLAILTLDHLESTVHIASANRPVYLIRQGQIEEIPCDKMSIGDPRPDVKCYSRQTVRLLSGDRIYLFTDGITDQFGGEQGRKYSTRRLREFLLDIQSLPLPQQLQAIEAEFENWKNGYNQLDDVCLIGLQPF